MKLAFSSWDTVYIRGKKPLIWGTVILVAVYLFSPFVLIQFVCVLLLFIMILSRLYSEYIVRNIHIIRRDAEFRVFRYEWVQAEIKVENHGQLPAFMLIINDTPGPLSVFKNIKHLCTLMPRSWTQFAWQGHCAERGVFTLGPVTVRGADPLGLFPFQLTARETSRLFVYPVLRSIALKNPNGIPLGNMISPNPLFEDITRRRSLRPYQSGDEPRRINWKASARMSHSGSLMVNEYDATASYPLMIFVNIDHHDYPVKKRSDYIERVIEAAAALCLKAARERQEFGIIMGDTVIAPAAPIVPILERLAALNWTLAPDTPKNSAMTMIEQGKYLPYGTRFFYVGPDLGDEAYISLNVLKRYHVFPEYLIIDGRALPLLVPGNSPRHQMKERGDDIV